MWAKRCHRENLRAPIVAHNGASQRFSEELLDRFDAVLGLRNARDVGRLHAQSAATMALETGQQRSVIRSDIDAQRIGPDRETRHNAIGEGTLVTLERPRNAAPIRIVRIINLGDVDDVVELRQPGLWDNASAAADRSSPVRRASPPSAGNCMAAGGQGQSPGADWASPLSGNAPTCRAMRRVQSC